MKKLRTLVALASLTLFVDSSTLMAVRNAHPAAKKTKPAAKPVIAPLPAPIEPGQPYFQPSHRLLGIGLDRQTMSSSVLDARTKNAIAAQAFSILRDPRSIGWAKTCTDPKLQAIFDKAVFGVDFPKATLEGIAFVESGCDPNAKSPGGAAGIMQIIAKTAGSMGLRIGHETKTRLIPQRKLVKRGTKTTPPVYEDLPPKTQKYQAIVDERFDPEKAIPAAARYLAGLAGRYGGVDFAVWAYHSGEGRIGSVRKLIKKYNISAATVPVVFFGNTPAWRKDLYDLIQKDEAKDFGPTYYFCVKQAGQLLGAYRLSPKLFEALARKYANSVKPDERAPNRLWVWYSPKDMYRNNNDLEVATNKNLVSVPQWPKFFSYSLRTFGAESIGEKDPEHRRLFLQDPPEVAGALEYVAFETRRFWEATHPKKEKFIPLEVTALVRNVDYQQLLAQNPNSHTAFPTYCIGAVDISYLRLPKWEAQALQFVIQDMGWDEYLSYFLESKSRETIHFGTSPSHKDFFISIYNEAKSYAIPKK